MVFVGVQIRGQELATRREVMRFLLAIFTRPTRRLWLVATLAGIFIWGAPVAALGFQNVELTWNPSPNTNVIGYNVYYGTESGSHPFLIYVDNVVSAQIYGLTEGVTYYFAVSASDSEGNESALSEEVSYTVPLPPPVVLQSQVFSDANGQPLYMVISSTNNVNGWWEMDWSSDLQNWNFHSFGYGYGYGNDVTAYIWLDANEPQKFFRLLKF